MKHVDRELLREVRAFAKNDGTKEQFRPIPSAAIIPEACRERFPFRDAAEYLLVEVGELGFCAESEPSDKCRSKFKRLPVKLLGNFSAFFHPGIVILVSVLPLNPLLVFLVDRHSETP